MEIILGALAAIAALVAGYYAGDWLRRQIFQNEDEES